MFGEFFIMKPLVLKKESARYYISVLAVFSGFGALGGIFLLQSYLFWPLMVVMGLFIAFTMYMKDGRIHEFYDDRFVIVSALPFQSKKEIRTILYSEIESITPKTRKESPGGEGYTIRLTTREDYILFTGYIKVPDVDMAITKIREGNPMLTFNNDAKEQEIN
jgi:hypothetical protein